MKELKGKLWAKITALLLLPVFAATAVLSSLGAAFLVIEDAYIDGGESLLQEINEDMIRSQLDDVLGYYEESLRMSEQGDQSSFEFLDHFYDRTRSNLIYSIVGADGTVLYTNDTGEETRYSCSTELFLMHYSGDQVTEEPVVVHGAVAENLSALDDFHRVDYWLSRLLSLMDALVFTAILSLLLCLALFIFLLSSAGHREGVEGIYLCWMNRLPFDLLAAALIAAGFFTVLFVADSRYTAHWITVIVLIILGGVLCLLFLIALLMSFAARAKAGRWWRNTVCWRLINSIFRIARWTVRTVCYPIRNLSGCWKALLLTGALMFGEFLLALMWGVGDTLPVFWLLERIVLLFLVAVFVLSFRRIEAGGRALASGDLSYQISTDFMQPPFLQHARHLNAIGSGMQKAVEQQMRSERMKTELITNVSHDIKTPLTSIVNYVGLMKSLDLKDETAQEYLEVLDRQSARLRKLTEDLVEASKASTGNLSVALEKTDLNLLLQQAAGEYEDRLRELQLEPVLRLSGEEAPIMADGKLLWRVFDNLMSNICKYSLSGTRVYLSTEIRDGQVTASFKNISRYALDISSDELMERFVRGDSSRSTEGSGLGLSIARSLTTLQGGSFDLSIDGDLFRADVSFSLAE